MSSTVSSSRGIDLPRSFLPSSFFTPSKSKHVFSMADSPTFGVSSPLADRLSSFNEEPYERLQQGLIQKLRSCSLSSSIPSIKSSKDSSISPSDIVVCKHKEYSDPPKVMVCNKEILKRSKKAEHCYENMLKIDDFCRNTFQKCPVNNGINIMISELRNPNCGNNAVWLPKMELVTIGPTDPKIFSRSFAIDEDILSHEFGHAFIQYAGGLRYENESGALNESLADTFAIMKKHFINKQSVKDASWVLADNIFVDEANKKKGLRSFMNPGSAFFLNDSHKDLQVKHMRDYQYDGYDNGGVHINSGIINHAFYLAATKEGGNSWEKIGKIWFDAFKNCPSKPDVGFVDFAESTIKVANKEGSGIENIVGQAWTEVGFFEK